VAAGVAREAAPAVSWKPVRCVEGAEDHEPVTVAMRTQEWDRSPPSPVYESTGRTTALPAADKAIDHLRQDLDGSPRSWTICPAGTGSATDLPGGAY
jgi:hypothetical protein